MAGANQRGPPGPNIQRKYGGKMGILRRKYLHQVPSALIAYLFINTHSKPESKLNRTQYNLKPDTCPACLSLCSVSKCGVWVWECHKVLLLIHFLFFTISTPGMGITTTHYSSPSSSPQPCPPCDDVIVINISVTCHDDVMAINKYLRDTSMADCVDNPW